MEEFPTEDTPQPPEEKEAEIEALEKAEEEASEDLSEEELEGEVMEDGSDLPSDILNLGTRTPEDDERTNREMVLDSEEIAQIAHAATAKFREIAGLEPWPAWEDLAEEDRLYRRILVLKDIMPGIASLDSHSFSGALHDDWLFKKLQDSWTWGPSLDEEARTDPRILPYTRLSKAEQWVWVVFRDTCRAFARGGVYSNS